MLGTFCKKTDDIEPFGNGMRELVAQNSPQPVFSPRSGIKEPICDFDKMMKRRENRIATVNLCETPRTTTRERK
jgi:hypothetical protein